MATFEVQHRGKTYTVNEADHPDELWLPLDGDALRVCSLHRLVFNTRDVCSYERRGEGASAAEISHSCGCADCYWDHWRPPKQTEIGLLELPAWWEPSSYFAGSGSNERIACLYCTIHRADFNVDESCRKCVNQDNEREAS